MRKHRTFRVREEIMQVMKSLLSQDDYVGHVVNAGMVPELVATMNERPDSMTDQSVGCETLRYFVAPHLVDLSRRANASAANVTKMQSFVGKAGALEAMTKALELASNLSLSQGFGGQNAAALGQYNVERECSIAVAILSWKHNANQAAFVRLGAPALIVQGMRAKAGNQEVHDAGCIALAALAGDGSESKAAIDAIKPQSCKAV